MMRPFPFILLRAPLQPLHKVSDDIPEKDAELLFQEGLYLSSPEFWQEFQKRDHLSGKEMEKMDRGFAKYWLRSCVRCTPYGTFAGSAIVDIVPDGETALILDSPARHRRVVRLDMNCITAIIQALIRIPAIRDGIRYFTNNSLYELPTGIRYAEYKVMGGGRKYTLTSIKKSDYLHAVLTRARDGVTIDTLAQLLVGLEDVSFEEAREFVFSMVESQLLLPELEPGVTGEEPLTRLIRQMEALPDSGNWLAGLRRIQDLLHQEQPGVGHYEAIERELKALGLIEVIPKNALQVDLTLALKRNQIRQDLVHAIADQANDLFLLSMPGKIRSLDEFKERFLARYEQEEVPLTQVLDIEYGIGYAGWGDQNTGNGELVDELDLVARGDAGSTPYDPVHQFALLKYQEYLEKKKPLIEIEESELKQFEPRMKQFRFANSIYLMGKLMKKDGRLDPENFYFDISNFGGPSAGNLLGRFTHGDETLCRLTRDILAAEEQQQPDAIYAEIVHLPEDRIGNVILRPVLRKYEIPYIGISGAPAEDQILTEDLMVSVRGGQIVLRSKRLNKIVIPRLTTAHNFSWGRNLPLYRFLCELQMQEISHPAIWDWRNLQNLKHLPRVVYKNLIIRKAQWVLEEKELANPPAGREERLAAVETLRIKREIPEQVLLIEGDNKLLLRLQEYRGVALLLYYLKRNKQIQLEEFLFTRENMVVEDGTNAQFTNELIIPLQKDVPVVTGSVTTAFGASKLQRKFAPGSEWLYVKIYTGPKTGETLLRTHLAGLIEEGLRDSLFERFFFIRYRDEGSHLRFRFFNRDGSRQAVLQQHILRQLQPMLEDGTIHSLVLDTYTRELERYGEDCIETAENLFANDSLAMIRFLGLLDGPESERYRLLFALRSIDLLLNDFGLSLKEKQSMLKRMQENFFREFGGSPTLQKQLNERYRKYQQFLFSHMDPGKDAGNEIEDAVAVFRTRGEMNVPVVEQIRAIIDPDPEHARLFELLFNVLHMSMNRLFISRQRHYELVVYHFLEKFYTSRLAISTNKAH